MTPHIFLTKFCAFTVSIALILCCVSCKKHVDKSPPLQQEVIPYPTVIIDAGHGGEDCGAIGKNGVLEKDLNLSIALELQKMLEAAGIPTRLTRDCDTLLYDKNSDYHGKKKILDMQARRQIINQYSNAVFISIHMNSFPQEKYSGLQVYYSPNTQNSEQLAQYIQDTVRSNLQHNNDRKIKSSEDNIYLLNDTPHPSVLIECGFLSNREECELLCEASYQKRLSMCIYAAIVNYLSFHANNNT